MPNILIANITPTREKKQLNYKFTVMLDNGIIIPGFHTYSGILQAPHNKGKNSWYPTIYLPPVIAEGIYKAFVKAAAENNLDIKLHSLETNLKYLAYDEVTIDRLNMLAGEEKAA